MTPIRVNYRESIVDGCLVWTTELPDHPELTPCVSDSLIECRRLVQAQLREGAGDVPVYLDEEMFPLAPDEYLGLL